MSVQKTTLPTAAAQAAVAFVVFIGSAVGGAILARNLAPDSLLAPAVGFFSFLLSFVFGMQLWLGAALLTAVWHLFRGNPGPRVIEIPPGSWVFVPTSIVIATIAGIAIAIVGSSIGAAATIALYAVLGTIFGVTCALLARTGLLPFPSH